MTMGEFDLDPQIQGATGFGWEAHFGAAAPAGVVVMGDTDSNCCVYPCDPTWQSCSCVGTTCGGTCAPPGAGGC
jgi:hypothetical protein